MSEAKRSRGPVPEALAAPSTPPLALLLVALVAAACVVTSVTWRIQDPDLFQHLLVGKVIWTEHRIPTTQEWSWPTYGAPDVNPSWGFRALLWPCYAVGGEWGLFAWRWLTSLAAFGLAWLVARRLGARGVLALVVIAWCALIYRQRSLTRPETISAVLLMLEVWILETRRRGGPDRWPWLVAIACVWINTHIAYWFGFAVQGIYLLDAVIGSRDAARRSLARSVARGLMLSIALGLIVSLINPFGWRALWAPFDYALNLSREAIFQNIVELRPVFWAAHQRNGLVLLVALWPLLAIVRSMRRGADIAELLMCALFTYLGITSQRFTGIYALIAAPFVARGLHELGEALTSMHVSGGSVSDSGALKVLAGVRPGIRNASPARQQRKTNESRFAAILAPLKHAWLRAALAAFACVAISIPEWMRPDIKPGVGVDLSWHPVAACDFIAKHDVRGRFFNNFALGGYLAWRFYPERDRLPFMDIHQSGGPAIRREYMAGLVNAAGWRAVDEHWKFGAAIVRRPPDGNFSHADRVEGDPAFALVFQDDVAAVFVKRTSFPALADSLAYRTLSAGGARLAELKRACYADTALRRRARAELERAIASSEWNGQASALLGHFDALENRLDSARAHLERAASVNPIAMEIHEQLGLIALIQGRPADALREFRAERLRRLHPNGLDLRFGQAWQGLGEFGKARAAYRAELARGRFASEAAESLRVIEGR